jgi:hypothetical protein
MTCEEVQHLAWLAEDGEALSADAARHLAACPACREARDGHRRVVEAYRALGEPVPETGLRVRVEAAARASTPTLGRPRFWAAAAAAALLLAVVSLDRGTEPRSVPVAAPGMLAFDTPRESVESRLGYLEWDVAPGYGTHQSYTTDHAPFSDRWGIGTLRRRIETLEKTLQEAAPRDPDQGAVPRKGGSDRAC